MSEYQSMEGESVKHSILGGAEYERLRIKEDNINLLKTVAHNCEKESAARIKRQKEARIPEAYLKNVETRRVDEILRDRIWEDYHNEQRKKRYLQQQ